MNLHKDNPRNAFVGSFVKSLGAIFALILIVVLIGSLGFGVIYFHDQSVSRKYSQSPTISQEFDWGGLKARVEIERKELRQDSLASSQELIDLVKQDYAALNCDALGAEADQIIPGRVKTYREVCNNLSKLINQDPDNGPTELIVIGKVYVKNNTWNKTLSVPDNMLQLHFKGKQDGKTIEFAHLSSIPNGTSVPPRQSLESDLRIQILLTDVSDLGELKIVGAGRGLALEGYEEAKTVEVKN